MMQIRDELSGLFASMLRQPGARPFYLEAWNGERHVVERVDNKRSLTVPNLLIGVIGGGSQISSPVHLPATKTECTQDFCTAGPCPPTTTD
jgi:hypothetical protein